MISLDRRKGHAIMQRLFSPLLPFDILSHRAGTPRLVVCQDKTAHWAVFYLQKGAQK